MLRLVAILVVSALALPIGGTVQAQSSGRSLDGGASQAPANPRCEAAADLLADRSSLAPDEIAYFEEIVGECRSDNPPPRRAPTSTGGQAIPTGPFTFDQCNSARSEMIGMTTAAERNSDRAKRLLHIYTSDDCTQIVSRRAVASDANPGIASMMDMLREEGIDIDARMAEVPQWCRNKVARDIAMGATGDRQSLQEDCVVQRQLVVYTQAIEDMNEARSTSYERSVQQHREEVAALERQEQERQRKIAADKADYERRMAEWRRAVRLCNEGKREYCQPN